MTAKTSAKKFKEVTTAQLESIRKLCNDKGICRDEFQQEGIRGGIFSRALDEIKQRRAQVVGDIIAPPGGRIHTLRIPVVNDRDWQGAIDAAGPNTPKGYNVRNVDNLYLPEGTGEEEAEMVLVNFGPSGGSWDKALAWARQFNLSTTNPRQVFALGEHHPNLHRDLGMNPMYVVATKECTFGGGQRACFVWWFDADRAAYLRWVSLYGSACAWFAFLRK